MLFNLRFRFLVAAWAAASPAAALAPQQTRAVLDIDTLPPAMYATLGGAVLTVSAAQGSPEERLDLNHAIRTWRGSLIALGIPALRVLVFDTGGRRVSLFGGSGRGEGRFVGGAQILEAPGDSLLVVDRVGRVAVYDSTFAVRRTYQLIDTLPGAQRTIASVGPGGRLMAWVRYSRDDRLLQTRAGMSIATGGPQIFRDSLFLLEYDHSGNLLWSHGPILGPTTAMQVSRRADRGQEAVVANRVIPFATVVEPPVAFGRGTFYVRRDAEDEIVAYSMEDRTSCAIRLRPTAAGNDEPAVHPLARQSITAFLTDGAGSLWYEVPGRREGPRRWLVFGARCTFLGRAETPADWQVLEVGRDFAVLRLSGPEPMLQVRQLLRVVLGRDE